MKILSFDVGIKNLAYCVINKNEEKFKIEDWGIINLNDDKKTCTCINNRKKICGKTAFYSYMNGEKKEYYCKKHKDTYVTPNITVHNCDANMKCCYKNKNNVICNKKALHKIVNDRPLCNAHLKMEINSAQKEIGPIKLQSQNCNKIAMQTLATKLFKSLDEKKNFLTVNEVLIENQPTFKNPTMKTISTFIYGYFCLRGIKEKNINNSQIEYVKFFSPSNKLKVDKVQSDKLLKKGKTAREVYDITKELGEAYCKALIRDDIDNLTYLNKQDKKDDLCDSFLQGFYYLYYKNETALPDKYKLILEKVSKEIDDINKLKLNNKKINNGKEQKISDKKTFKKKLII